MSKKSRQSSEGTKGSKQDGLRERASSQANEYQVGGSHYKERVIQPWDFIASNGLDFFQGSVVKYVTRWKEKGGVEDLRKARHYLEKYIELQEGRTTVEDLIRRGKPSENHEPSQEQVDRAWDEFGEDMEDLQTSEEKEVEESGKMETQGGRPRLHCKHCTTKLTDFEKESGEMYCGKCVESSRMK